MPTYEYECSKCHKIFEVRQRISADPLTTCECGGAVHRLLSAAPFILKGEGWYVTDYPSEARKKARESEKGADKKPSGEKPSGEKSSGEQSSTPAPAAASPAAPSSASSSGTASPASSSSSSSSSSSD